MIKLQGSVWQAFPALGLDRIAGNARVQTTVYLASMGGIDYGYEFALHNLSPLSLELAVDFADWRETPEAPLPVGRKLEEVEKRFAVVLEVTKSAHAEWLEALCSVHYLATHSGIAPDLFSAQYGRWSPTLLTAAREQLATLGWLSPRGEFSRVISTAELPAGEDAICQSLLHQAAAIFEATGYTLSYSIEPKECHVDASPDLRLVPPAGSAAATETAA